jgi:hypothetical protein
MVILTIEERSAFVWRSTEPPGEWQEGRARSEGIIRIARLLPEWVLSFCTW